jgi:hypothetical protein
MRISKALSWDDLAEIYDKRTGGHARTMSMDSIFTWAESKKNIFFIHPQKGTIHLHLKLKEAKC